MCGKENISIELFTIWVESGRETNTNINYQLLEFSAYQNRVAESRLSKQINSSTKHQRTCAQMQCAKNDLIATAIHFSSCSSYLCFEIVRN